MISNKSTNDYLQEVKDKCIDCGKCTKCCPFLTKYKINLKDYADKKEDTQKDDQQLTDDEKATIDEFVERLEKYEVGTAGASLKMDRLFTEIVNRCEFLETKPEQSQQYFIKKVSEVKDTENFKMAVKALKNTMDYYKEDKQAYIKQLEDSGSEWNPQIKLETLENLVNKF